MDLGIRVGQGDQRGGDSRAGDGEDQLGWPRRAGRRGGLGGLGGRVETNEGPGAATAGSSVFVMTGWTLSPVSWYRVGAWMFAEEMTTDEKALCKWRHAPEEVAPVAPGSSLYPQGRALLCHPTLRVNHPQTRPAV